MGGKQFIMLIKEFEKDIEAALSESGNLLDVLEYQEYKNRWLIINSDIDRTEVDYLSHQIIRYNYEDNYYKIPVDCRRPIIVYITSSGGDVDAGFELIDVIKSSITPIYTVNMCCQYSMGCLVGLAGHKRFANENAKFLIHDGSFGGFECDASKMKDFMKFNEKIERRVKDYIIERTKITTELYDKKIREEWYMFADEAKSYGLIEYIIGQDCDINLNLIGDEDSERI